MPITESVEKPLPSGSKRPIEEQIYLELEVLSELTESPIRMNALGVMLEHSIDNFEKFKKISIGEKLTLAENSDIFTAHSLNQFLTVLGDTDDTISSLIQSPDSYLLASPVEHEIYETLWNTPSEWGFMITSRILTKKYGETVVGEMVRTVRDAGYSWWRLDVTEVLDNWSTLREQPASWIYEIYAVKDYGVHESSGSSY